MYTFTVTHAGQLLLANAVEGTSPVLIDSILLTGAGNLSAVSPVTLFSGSVVSSSADIGDYVVISFDDADLINSYTIEQIVLRSGATDIATSEAVSIVKAQGKTAKYRLSCKFDGANKCAFKNTCVSMPYASKYKDGIIRLARTSDEIDKLYTVYSAYDVETIIADAMSDSSLFVTWDLDAHDLPINGYTTVTQITVKNGSYSAPLTVNSSGNLVINNIITGDAITSQLTDISTGATKIVSAGILFDYISNADTSYVHIAGAETITGAKTFTNNVVISGTGKSITTPTISSSSYTGSGVYSTYASGTGSSGWSNSANGSRITTVSAVAGAINASETTITAAYQNADSSLQSQIDALNAGQNLADIVATKSTLDALNITNLKQGDKVQVLVDETQNNASTVYSLSLSGTSHTWTYIGKYGQDSYTKSEADNLFVEDSQIKQTVDSTKTAEIPSSSAVASYVSTEISAAAADYVKLLSSTAQSIVSPLSITGQVAINNITLNNADISSSYFVSGSSSYIYKISPVASNDSKFCIKQLNGTSTISKITFDGDNHSLSLYNGIGDLVLSSGVNLPHDVNGALVASYRDIVSGTLSDGRLVTVDYMNSAISAATPTGVAYLSQNNSFTGSNTFSGGSGSSLTTTTFNGNVVLNQAPTGTGICTAYTNWASASSQIPTVTVVKSAISDAVPTNVSTFVNDAGYLTSYTETDPTVPSWAKSSTKPSYTLDEVTDGTSRKLPTNVSDLNNDSGFITGYTETDPTVPSWAKSSTKPSYTASEVGALPDTTSIPSNTSDLNNDSGYITSTDIPTNISAFYNDSNYITSSDIPSNISSFYNDSGYLTSSDFMTINNQSIIGSGNITISGYDGTDLIPSADDTYVLGSTSFKWNHIYGHSIHAWGNSPQYGVVLCDGNYESTAYSSITGYQSSTNGQMKFHHYNAANNIDYIVTSTGPNTTNTSATPASLDTVPQSDNTWTLGSPVNRLNTVYANTLFGLLESLYGSDRGAIYFFKLSITNKSSSVAYDVPRGTSLSDSAYFTTNSSASSLLYINSYEERVDDTSASAGTTTFSGTYYTLMRFKVDAGASSKSVYVPCLRVN